MAHIMDWNRISLTITQCVVVVTLGILAGIRPDDNTLSGGLVSICGAVAGISIYQVVSK